MRAIVAALLLISAVAIVAQATAAESDLTKECIFASAEHLPNAPGMVIRSSGAEPYNGKADMMMVRVNVTALGVDGTYSFLCTRIQGQGVVSRRVVE